MMEKNRIESKRVILWQLSCIMLVGLLVIYTQPETPPVAITYAQGVDDSVEGAEQEEESCIPPGDHTSIQNALTGPGAEAVLCPGAVFELSETVFFTANSQLIYTEGFPTDSTRALLKIVGDSVATAVSMDNRAGVKLSHVIIDGNRPELGSALGTLGGLIESGGNGAGTVVEWVNAYFEDPADPPGGFQFNPMTSNGTFQTEFEAIELSDYWVAYSSPTPYAVSMTFAEDTLWLADFLTGVFYKSVETANGLMILDSIQVDRDPFGQARDLTWNGENLWSINWGDLIRHDMNDSLLAPNLWITEAPIGSPNLHHMKGLAWDGTHLWSALDGNLYRHNDVDFSVELTIVMNQISPGGMSFKDGELWVCNRSMGFIERLDRYTGSPIQRYSIVTDPLSLAWSKTNLWIYDWSTNRIYKILSLPDKSLDPEDDYLQDGNFYLPPTPGESPDSVIWSVADSPYLIENGFNIPQGKTLIIEPGVKVYVRQGSFEVEGTLIAVGTADSMIVFSHASWDEGWGGLVFNGPEASSSILKYVKVQYTGNGIKGVDGAPQRIEHCIIRKLEVDGINLRLTSAAPESLYIVGNQLEMGGGVGIKMILSSQNPPGAIVIRENRIAAFYSTGPIIETDDGSAINQVSVMIDHNILEKGYRGSGSGTPGVAGVIYQHNLASNAISGSGVQPFNSGNVITHNLIEYTFENAYQLHPMHFVTRTVFQYNTVKWARFDHNWGDATVVVEYNNLIAAPYWEWWMEGIADIDGGYDVEMRHNWWGTNNLEEIRSHILDQNLEEDRGRVWIEPILNAPNGVGFIRGKLWNQEFTRPVPEVKVMVDTVVVYSNVAGEFFLATRSGAKELQVRYPDGQIYTYNTVVTSGEATRLELHPGNLVSVENGSIAQTFELHHNYPNPFNASTVIKYSLPKTGRVRLEIFNILGQKVRTLVNQWQAVGTHKLTWDATNDRGQSISSGVYFLRLQVADFVATNKMLLLR